MLDQIHAFLADNPKSKAKTIATALGVDKPDINRLLHDNTGRFEQDEAFRWSNRRAARQIEFGGRGWLTSVNFDRAFSGVSPLSSSDDAVVLVLKDDAKPMLAFIARLLALCNQLVAAGKHVTLDFEESQKALSYLDRVGFFGVLDSAIEVLPQRPSGDLSKAYQGNNNGVIEFRLIDPAAPDAKIPKLLRNSLVSCAGESYSKLAFTVLAELFGNVVDHADASSHGFAGLQFYPKARKIQAVISDNGRGIVGTLAPVVPHKYPEVAIKMEEAEHAGVALLTEVFTRGGLSQVNDEGRGVGLKRSGDVAEKFKATIYVRQSDFELRVYHEHDGVNFDHVLNLPYLEGTHICFEFKLDVPQSSD
ncbi:ATP-binding protein [Pandoraea sp. NPDC087047]|uniref:ATP-binding protein n=1 Tax=Pandoraea sp. NPDC087047 TaxID=3364390 RepID=UPI0038248F02